MKVKIYCVTYQGHKRLNKTLNSIFNSDISDHDYEVNIINNHTDIRVDKEFIGRVNIIHNHLRPDFSEGHLTRNWNQGIIHGFKDIENPDCDIVVNIQDDVIFRTDIFSKLKSLHENYDLIQGGQGDAIFSYKPNAIKNIGLWDERFCAISLQVADFLCRCKMFYPSKCSINDVHHNRILNPIIVGDPIASSGYLIRPNAREIDVSWEQGDFNMKYCSKLFHHKYGNKEWSNIGDLDKPLIKSYIYYPYFEKKIKLEGKNYFDYD